MKPGPELDALVAEKVMDAPMPLENVPAYSKDINEANKIPIHLSHNDKMNIEELRAPKRFKVTFTSKIPGSPVIEVSAEATTLAHAICEAALKAVGEDI